MASGNPGGKYKYIRPLRPFFVCCGACRARGPLAQAEIYELGEPATGDIIILDPAAHGMGAPQGWQGTAMSGIQSPVSN